MFLEELAAGLTEQGTVSLECKVVGIPSPTLRWFKDGEEIRSGDILALTPSLEKPVSVYRCDAVNCMGVVSSTSVLDVSQTLSNQWENYVITRKYLTENILETRPPLFSQRPCLIRKWRLESWWSWVLQVWQSELFPSPDTSGCVSVSVNVTSNDQLRTVSGQKYSICYQPRLVLACHVSLPVVICILLQHHF